MPRLGGSRADESVRGSGRIGHSSQLNTLKHTEKGVRTDLDITQLNRDNIYSVTSSHHTGLKMAFSQSTWRALGLSVAAGYTSLGLFATLAPRRAAAELFGIITPPATAKNSSSTTTSSTSSPATQDGAVVPLLMPLLGARDLSIAAALWALAYAGKWREAGTLVLAGTVLCAADVYVVWKCRGPAK